MSGAPYRTEKFNWLEEPSNEILQIVERATTRRA
jgi:hypothetical protein